MRLIAVFHGLCTLLFACEIVAQPPTFPDDAAYQEAVAATELALASGDLDALVERSLELQRLNVLLPDLDPRVVVGGSLILRTTVAMQALAGPVEFEAILDGINAVAEEVDRGRNAIAWSVVETLFRLRLAIGDSRGARSLVRDVVGREERLAGPDHPRVRAAMLWHAEAAAAAGETREALAMLEESLASTVRQYGDGAPDSAPILVLMAQIYLDQEQYDLAVAMSDQVLDILTGNSSIFPRLPQELGSIYFGAGRFEKARDMYLIMESIMSSDELEVAFLRWDAQRNLAMLNAYLGDVAAMRNYLDLADEHTRTPNLVDTEVQVGTIELEVELFTLAGMYDEATSRLADLERYGESEGLMRIPEFRLMLASRYLQARVPERAAELASELVTSDYEDSGIYDDAARILVSANALTEPPVALSGLARELLDRAESARPDSRHSNERFALAMSLAAEGRWQDSVGIQEEIAEADASWVSDYRSGHLQSIVYANALEQLGRREESSRVSGGLAQREAAIRDIWSGQSTAEAFVEEHSDFGFEISLGEGWKRAASRRLNIPQAVFSAAYGTAELADAGGFVVVPVLLPEGARARSVVEALSPIFGVEVKQLERWSDGGLEGFQFIDTENVDGGEAVIRRARFVVGPAAVYMIAGIAPAAESGVVSALEKAFERVVILPDAAASELRDDHLEQHGMILNTTGNGLFSLERYEEARNFYLAASEYIDEDFLTKNLAGAQFWLRNWDEVIRLTLEYEARFAPDEEMLLWRAESYRRKRDYEEALKDYELAFALGADHDVGASNYLSLLIRYRLNEQATGFLDDYASRHDSLDVHAMQATLGLVIEDEDRLDDALDVIMDPERSRPDVAILAVQIADRRDGYGGLLRYSRLLIDDGLDSPELYALLATRQMQTGRWDDARETIDRGLARYPGNRDLEKLTDNFVEE